MGMVGSRGTTFRTVVEHQQLGIVAQQPVDLTIHILNRLRRMLQGGQREVHGQYGERIYQEFPLAVDGALQLFLRAVLGAKETGALAKAAAIDFGSSGNHTGGIPLQHNRCRTVTQLAGLYLGEFPITSAGIGPCLQLTFKKAL